MSKKKTKVETTQNTNSTQTAAPPTWTMPGLQQAANAVTAGIGQIPTTHYSGPMVATMDPAQLAAIQAAWGATATNAGELAAWQQSLLPALEQGMNFTTALPSTAYSLAPRQELDAVIEASLDPVMKNLMQNILPSITHSALESGAYSGDRAMSVLPTEAIDRSNESMQRIAAQLGYEDYQNYENRRLAAFQATTAAAQGNYGLETQRQQAEMAARLQQLGLSTEMINSILHTQASQGDLLNLAAQLGVTNTQAGYNNAVQMDQYASQAPFMGLDTATQLLAALSQGWGTTTGQSSMTGTQTTTQSGGLAEQLIQGALGVGMMAMGAPPGSMFGNLFGGGQNAAPPAASSIFVQPVNPSNINLGY